MKEVDVSETTGGIVKAGAVINKIKEVDRRYELSKMKSENLLNDLNETSNIINNTDTNFWGNYRKDDLFSLIRESHNSTLKTTKITSDLITNSNENSKILSEMIGALAMLSGLSFEKISENSTELEEITKELEKGVDGVDDNSTNIKRVVVSQINRVKEENKKQEKIDYNFGVLNENFKELQIEFKEYREVNEKKIKEVKKLYQTSSEDHFIKRLKKQKTMIYILFFLVIISLVIQLFFLI